jgi:hypothetical protein
VSDTGRVLEGHPASHGEPNPGRDASLSGRPGPVAPGHVGCQTPDVSETGDANGGYSPYFLKTTQALWPPKPKLFETATCTSASRDSFGT